jgi:hypothetical protein
MAILTLTFEVSQLSNDHSGRYVAMVPAFQGTANVLGPVIGGLS